MNEQTTTLNKPTDEELILAYLHDGEWHNVIDMMREVKPDCVNWAARSRISDINRKALRDELPYKIDSYIDSNRQAKYKLTRIKVTPKVEPQTIKPEFDKTGQGTFFNEVRDGR